MIWIFLCFAVVILLGIGSWMRINYITWSDKWRHDRWREWLLRDEDLWYRQHRYTELYGRDARIYKCLVAIRTLEEELGIGK